MAAEGTMMATGPKPAGRRWLRLAIEALVVAAIFLGVGAWNARGAISGAAPPIQGTSITGAPLSLSPGEPTVVHFWATWCGVCQAQKGAIDSLARDKKVITIAEDSGSAAQVSAYLQKAGVSFPVLMDEGGRLARAYGVGAFPTTFVVGPDGQVSFAEVGYTTEWGLRARLWLSGL